MPPIVSTAPASPSPPHSSQRRFAGSTRVESGAGLGASNPSVWVDSNRIIDIAGATSGGAIGSGDSSAGVTGAAAGGGDGADGAACLRSLNHDKGSTSDSAEAAGWGSATALTTMRGLL